MAECKIDPKILITFPGCGGNARFYLGVMHVISTNVDMSQLAFLTRSGTGYVVALALSGNDVEECSKLWTARSRSYFKETGVSHGRGLFEAAKQHSLTVMGPTPPNTKIPHHVEVIDTPWMTRRWISEWDTIEDYIHDIAASCHIPWCFTNTFSNAGRLDGSVRVPYWTSSYPAVNQTIYRGSISVRFKGSKTSGFSLGMVSPDFYLEQGIDEFNQGVIYAKTILRETLLGYGIPFVKEVPANSITDEKEYGLWCTAENKYVLGQSPEEYPGPWWARLYYSVSNFSLSGWVYSN